MSGRVCAILLVAVAVAAASPHKLCAGTDIEPAEPLSGFDLRRPAPAAPELLGSLPGFNLERGGGGRRISRAWPWRGFSFSLYLGHPIFPVNISHGMGISVPLGPNLSAILRVEFNLGLSLIGGVYEHGLRGHIDLSPKVDLYIEGCARLMEGGTPVYDTGAGGFAGMVDPTGITGGADVAAFGFSVGAGIEAGAGRIKFITGGLFSISFYGPAVNYVDPNERNSGVIPIFGAVLGLRVYVG